jgi:hypothetical protein
MAVSPAARGGSGSSTTAAPAAAEAAKPAETTAAAAAAETPAPSADKKVINLVIGAGHTAGSMEYIDSLDNFFKPEVAKRVAEKTDYEIQWTDAYGTVVGISETVTGTQDGLLDFCVITASPVSGQLPYH